MGLGVEMGGWGVLVLPYLSRFHSKFCFLSHSIY